MSDVFSDHPRDDLGLSIDLTDVDMLKSRARWQRSQLTVEELFSLADRLEQAVRDIADMRERLGLTHE